MADMRRLRIAGMSLAVLPVVVLAALLLARAAFGTTNTAAQSEVRILFERAGHRGVDVQKCRPATESDVDSATRDTFVCAVATPSCKRDFIVVARAAVEPGWLDGNSLGSRSQPTVARYPGEVYRFCHPRAATP
jgi:hypothetical protein